MHPYYVVLQFFLAGKIIIAVFAFQETSPPLFNSARVFACMFRMVCLLLMDPVLAADPARPKIAWIYVNFCSDFEVLPHC